jgi:hypothetical protein
MPERGNEPADAMLFDLLVIGASPTGLAAPSTKRAGLRVVSVEGLRLQFTVSLSLAMTFFTTSELLEIGDIPFPVPISGQRAAGTIVRSRRFTNSMSGSTSMWIGRGLR